jgi:16S rRNA processing protein RimM
MKILVAHIKKPRGLNGELAVIPYKEDTQSLRKGLEVTLQKGDLSRETVVESVVFLNGRLALKFAGIASEEQARQWQGGEVLAESEDLASLRSDEFYHFEIEGCEVYEEGGAHLGKVAGIDFISANDVLTVETESGEILIPFIKRVISSVDIKAKKITIRKIEGLY